MPGPELCTVADLYQRVQGGTMPKPARLIAAVDAGTDVLTLDEHGYAADEVLVFRAEAGGSLPSPLVAGTTYYAIPLTDATFRVSATVAGTAINLTTAGSNVLAIQNRPYPAHIQRSSARIISRLIAHKVPLDEPYPVEVVDAAAYLAIESLYAHTGQVPGTLQPLIDAAKADLERWLKTATIRGAIVPASANLALVGNVAASDPHGWTPEGGGLP
jgi:hypothetical protein